MRDDRRGTLVRKFFAGLTEYAFCARMGVADPQLVDYISELLVRFVHSDEVYAVRSVRGNRMDRVADLLAEAEQREGPARRQVHRHIGDFTLFWTGIYPEVVEGLRKKGGKDSLIDYPTQGKKAYRIASTIPVEKELAPTAVLHRLSEEYDLCVYGLSEIRRQWDERDNNGDSPLLLG